MNYVNHASISLPANVFYQLENSFLAESIRRSLWLYPFLEIVHIIGIVLLVGAVVMFDFRLIGLSKNLPLMLLGKHLLPWSLRALFLIIPSGVLLFITNAETLGRDPTFWIKLTLILLAGLNAAFFHRFLLKSSRILNENFTPSPVVKVVALLSITLWLAIIACGRLLAY